MLHQVPRVHAATAMAYTAEHCKHPRARESSTVVIFQCWGMLLPWNYETKAQVTF